MRKLDAGNAQELFKSGEIRLKRKILEADMMNDVKDRGDYLNAFDDQKEHEERLLTLRDRRNTKKLQENSKNNNDNYLKNFEGLDDPLENTK
jgi:transcription elongation GreA/GreB family factor